MTTQEQLDPSTSPASTSADPAQPCGCPDFTMSRRRVLAGATGAVGLGLMSSVLGDVHRQVAFGAEGNGNVLVVLSMRGGADGLSMVVPYNDTALASARPRIGIPAASLLGKGGTFGLHPSFDPLLPMWAAGTFGAVHAVGLNVPNRSHFQAMEVIEDADPGASERRGWINRLIGLDAINDPAQAVQLGSSMVPTSLYGSEAVLGLKSLEDLSLAGDDPTNKRRRKTALHRVWDSAPGSLGQGVRAALATSEKLDYLAEPKSPLNGARYPAGDLGDALAETATLVRANVGAKVVTLDYGSWDMHTLLGRVDGGSMTTMITELAACLHAFFLDIGSLSSRVTVVTISEFGRRLEENGAGGLDHGWGNCMLMLGAGVRGRQVHGKWAGLTGTGLKEGDLAVQQDYRSVLSEVVRSRFPELDSTKVFPDFTPEVLNTMA